MIRISVVISGAAPMLSKPKVDMRPTRFIWAVTAVTALAHLATAGRYDIFRNELYFIVCGRHPAFGYVDQPPLVPLLAAATQGFGIHPWLLRLPAVCAAAALIPLTASLADLLGARASDIRITCLAVALAPALIGLTTILTTETFEPLAWTAVAYAFTRAACLDDRRALVWAGVIAGGALEAKYGIIMWLGPLLAGLLLTAERRMLGWREAWIGAAACVVLAAPSLLWQASAGWPFLVVVANHSPSNLTGGPVGFEIAQILALNPLLAPLWLAGLVGPFVSERLRPVRFLAFAFLGATLMDELTHGKDYYLFAAYPTMFALGAVTLERLRPALLATWMTLAAALTLLVTPVVLPLLTPSALARYLARTHLQPRPDEVAAMGAPLTQVFSDELGWRALELQVAEVFHSLSPAERRGAAILTTNYGEAAALDVYGRDDGLPPAATGQNQYFLWGPPSTAALIVHVNGDPERWRSRCRDVQVVARFGAPFVMPYESDRPIFICREPRFALARAWPRFRRYQ
jgi:4-amino-4-deoxy-L-arabinose transferase-like glycosyltransferase